MSFTEEQVQDMIGDVVRSYLSRLACEDELKEQTARSIIQHISWQASEDDIRKHAKILIENVFRKKFRSWRVTRFVEGDVIDLIAGQPFGWATCVKVRGDLATFQRPMMYAGETGVPSIAIETIDISQSQASNWEVIDSRLQR